MAHTHDWQQGNAKHILLSACKIACISEIKVNMNLSILFQLFKHGVIMEKFFHVQMDTLDFQRNKSLLIYLS